LAWQIQFISSTFLAGALLVLIVHGSGPLGRKGTWLAGTCLTLLALCGTNGLALVPALALWLAYAGALCWGRPSGTGRKRDALLAWAFAAVALLIVLLAFLGYEKPSHHPEGNDVWETLRLATQFFAAALGPGPELSWWPYSGLGAVGLLLLSGALLAVALLKRREERFRAAGLLLFLGGLACLALGIGWGRAEIHARYVTLAAPALCSVYVIAEVYGGRALGPVVQLSLLVLVIAALPLNAREGLKEGRERRRVLSAFAEDVRAGAPLHEVAERYSQDVYWYTGGSATRKAFADFLAALQEAGMEPYRALRRDPVAESAMTGDDPDYPRLIENVRREVAARLPEGATVVVVSHGEDELLRLGRRRSWHFPQADDASYSSARPANSAAAIAHLEELQAKGAQHLVFPKVAFWWLDEGEGYKEFKQYLDRRCRHIYRDENCIIYQLTPKG
jgi:hypothetical protein